MTTSKAEVDEMAARLLREAVVIDGQSYVPATLLLDILFALRMDLFETALNLHKKEDE